MKKIVMVLLAATLMIGGTVMLVMGIVSCGDSSIEYETSEVSGIESEQEEPATEGKQEEPATEEDVEMRLILVGYCGYKVPKDADVSWSYDIEDIANYGSTSKFDDHVVRSYAASGSPELNDAVATLYPGEPFVETTVGRGVSGMLLSDTTYDVDGRKMYRRIFCTVIDGVFHELLIQSYSEDMSEVEGIVLGSLTHYSHEVEEYPYAPDYNYSPPDPDPSDYYDYY